MAFSLEASETVNDDLLGFSCVAPALNVDKLARLEVLVTLEEVVDLVLGLLRNIVDVLDVSPTRILSGNADDLCI